MIYLTEYLTEVKLIQQYTDNKNVAAVAKIWEWKASVPGSNLTAILPTTALSGLICLVIKPKYVLSSKIS